MAYQINTYDRQRFTHESYTYKGKPYERIDDLLYNRSYFIDKTPIHYRILLLREKKPTQTIIHVRPFRLSESDGLPYKKHKSMLKEEIVNLVDDIGPVVGWHEGNLPQNIYLLDLSLYEACERIYYQPALQLLSQLNMLLLERCPSLYLSIGKPYEMVGEVDTYAESQSGLILCLYTDLICMSSLNITIGRGVLMIESLTKPEYRKRKYNKLLRAVIFMIAPYLYCHHSYRQQSRPHALESIAVNNISIWSLINYNDIDTDPLLIEYIEETKGTDKWNYTNFLQFMQENDFDGGIWLELPFSPANIRVARSTFDDLTKPDSRLVC